jgi:inner membrane protein
LDIITHTLSGALVGATVSSFTDNTRLKIWSILAGTLGGCLPDIDAISLWSGFDDTIVKWFHLDHAGQDIYFSKFWYSHHGFFHSIAAIVFYLLLYLMGKKITDLITQQPTKVNIYGCVAFSGGYLAHILEDLPTPGLSWGGVNLFWPSSQWVGGTGQTWWWNNYDIFLIVLIAAMLNLGLTLSHFDKKKLFSLCILSFSALLIIFQIHQRNFDFNTEGYGNKEAVSLTIQRNILGEKVFDLMVKLDNKIHLNF